MEYKSFCKTEIIWEQKQYIIQQLKSLENDKLILFASENDLSSWGLLEEVHAIQNKNILWIKERFKFLTQDGIFQVIKEIKKHNFEPTIIMTIGGGTSIDLAKAISALFYMNLSTPEEVLSTIKDKKYKENYKTLDIIAIPTTSGTGSELTQWATVWETNGKGKFSIDDIALSPIKAIMIPELTVTLPKRITLATALDALAQAIEAYWSKNTNFLIKDIALRSVELITHNLSETLQDPTNIRLRTNLMRASLLSALAFSNTRTTACHSISYPITQHFGVEHGFAVALTLSEVARLNEKNTEDIDQLYKVFEEFSGIRNWINKVCEGIVQLNLTYFGIHEEDIPYIVERAFTAGRMDNNPVDLEPKDVEAILRKIL
ncbi:phosphonoacetaldehyde reductase [Clostridium aminobutyricum]|uniref:Phosphonoacetaldehyde reductase n=1 Tax=Clostridium aminobutyricum TaxID=33953 RepID=A0A939D987_CLOAM|nr:phosphonoacetaldehyde reductase [Clostridium aminobutyricum]MBN7773749.1 phosphonoacetaldehyde reductase [Clostridium aminobutyricum]